MKKTILYSIISVTLLLSSCSSWLDVTSKTNVVEHEMFSDERGFMEALAGVYYLMSEPALYGDKLTMGLVDVLAHRYNFVSNDNDEYKLDFGTASYYNNAKIKSYIDDIWAKGYNVIANANNLLHYIEGKEGLFTDNNYNLIKGEALGLRAFLHFDLLRLFGPSYLVGPDVESIPYLVKIDGKNITPLSTVSKVADKVIEELLAAELLLETDDIKSTSTENSWINSRSQHFNIHAVQATLARVYLYVGNKTEALKYANKVIDTENHRFFDPTVDTNSGNIDISFSKEHLFSLPNYTLKDIHQKYFGMSALSLLTNDKESLQSIYEIASGGSTDYRYIYLWKENDETKKHYYEKYNYNLSGIRYPANLIPLIRLPEMYYIAAECSGDVKYLNEILANRGLRKLEETITADKLANEIFKEYQKEFYGEGQLFHYYKRLNMAEMLDYSNLKSVDSAVPGYVFPLPESEGFYRPSEEEVVENN